MITNTLGDPLCTGKINSKERCCHLARVKITRPNPVDPNNPPLYVCYSHLPFIIKRGGNGQFLVEKIELV